MNEKLAKQLKNAGFPWKKRHSSMGILPRDMIWDDNEYVPTLSELIVELGDKFGILERFENGKYGAYIPKDIGVSGTGDTPIEALANLYLAVKSADEIQHD